VVPIDVSSGIEGKMLLRFASSRLFIMINSVPSKRQEFGNGSDGVGEDSPNDSVARTVPRKQGKRRAEMLDRVKEFVRSEDGPTATEYAVMLALIIVVCIAAITTLGKKVNNVFSSVNSNITV
jgi:pilus assembly protein Flp/PilA